MDGVPQSLLTNLRLSQALSDEVAARQNLLPPEPWLQALGAQVPMLTDWIASRLRAGAVNARNVIVTARKNQGTRPVPLMGIAERVVYRALSSYILDGVVLPKRDSEEYRAFVMAPIVAHWADSPPGVRTIGGGAFSYVVEADVAAFYEYIDHGLLQQELQIQTNMVESVELLGELLVECEGKKFGLPQLYDPSDWLSEVYIRVVERDLLRQGFLVWRYNDDFRIGCRDYATALEAIEKLEEAARRVGLTLSAYKTYTPSFATYFFKNVGVQVSDDNDVVDPENVEAIASDYFIDDQDALELATNNLQRLSLPSEDKRRIDLKKIKSDEIRDLRGALSTLTRASDPQGLPWVRRLLEFVPSLTPNLIRYIISLNQDEAGDAAADVLDDLRVDQALSDWQAMWVLHALGELDQVRRDDVAEWIQVERNRRKNRAFAAEAAFHLSRVAAITFAELDQALRIEPSALSPWYVLGIKHLLSTRKPPSDRQVSAVRDASPLYAALLK